MSNVKIVWGYNDRDDLTKGWYIRVSDMLIGDLWAEKLIDVSDQGNIINIRGTDIGMIGYLLHNSHTIEDMCRLEKYTYEDSIQVIHNLSPSDFG